MQVYRLREKGQRLARDVVIARGPVCGELGYRERTARSGIYLASLVVDTAGTYGVPPLDRATLRRMTANGLMIFGQEVYPRGPSIKSSVIYWPQVWWCVSLDSEKPVLPTPVNVGRQMPAWQRAMGVTD